MKYAGYEVCPSFIHQNIIKWKLTGNGEYIIGSKNDNLYFIKRNLHIRYPSSTLPPKVYEKYRKVAKEVVERRKVIQTKMNSFDWQKDCIIKEIESFWDKDHMLVTITPYIPNLYKEKIKNLNKNQFLNLLIKTSILLDKLHTSGIIHGDIKEQNIIIDTNLTPYLIDFDCSYSKSSIPTTEDIGGTEEYLSPEIIAYESGNEGAIKEITEKTDVFSLGIVFHRWWTDLFPAVDLECGTVGNTIMLEKEIIINHKFDTFIGMKFKATLMSLLYWMMAKNQEDRPSMKEVINVLKDNCSVKEEFHIGSDFKPFDPLWNVHQTFAELLPIQELKAKGILSFKQNNERTGSLGLNYSLFYNHNHQEKISIIEALEMGYVKKKKLEIDLPWEMHNIEFISEEELLKKGIQKIKRKKRQRYRLTDNHGREYDCGISTLLQLEIIIVKQNQIYSDSPWEEHGKEYNTKAMERLGIKEILKVEILNEHKYKIIFHKEFEKEEIDNISVNNMKLMDLIL